MMTNSQYPVYHKFLFSVVAIALFGCFLLFRGTKEKTKFQLVKGQIVRLDKTFDQLPNRHQDKLRYLSIDSFPRVFELFIGKDFGDFKPEYERIDELKIGDTVSVYFDEDLNETDFRLNRTVQFIDKAGVPYFKRGSKDKYGGYFFIGFGIIMAALLFYFKRAGKIV